MSRPRAGLPPKQGLYDPAYEHDSCVVGFIALIKGVRSHSIVQKSLDLLCCMEHRGAAGSEPHTGDGGGILIQIPHKFFQKVNSQFNPILPAEGEYGVAHIFLPKDDKVRDACERIVEEVIGEQEQTFLGWRDVPTDNSSLGRTALDSEPIHRQAFIGRNSKIKDEDTFERTLYLIQRRIENRVMSSSGGASAL